MSDPDPDLTARLEGVVRAHLDRRAEGVDPRPLFERIQAGLARPDALAAPGPRPRRWARAAWAWGGYAAAAALLLVALTLVARDRPALASGATLVREARQAHRAPIDRCYLVEVRREASDTSEWVPAPPQVRTTRLWTRGDRFWVESTRSEERWAWGRDDANRFWIAFGRHFAVRLDADEVPFWLNTYCDLHSLNFEKWLGDVLNRFVLARETRGADADASTAFVRATAKTVAPQYPAVQTAELEIDAQTRVVRRMVVRRVLRGRPFVTVTYTLAETDGLDPAEYRLEGHLAEGAEVYTRDNKPERRKELLARWFGPRAGRPYRLPDVVK